MLSKRKMVTLPDKSYSRIIVVQILYILNLSSEEIKQLTNESIDKSILDISKFYDSENSDASDLIDVMKSKTKQKFIKAILKSLGENVENIDQTIVNSLVNKDSWKRVHILIKSILRAAIAEYLYLDTTRKVLVNEYVSIAGSFFSSKEIDFVNATLDKITKALSQKE